MSANNHHDDLDDIGYDIKGKPDAGETTIVLVLIAIVSICLYSLWRAPSDTTPTIPPPCQVVQE